MAHIKLKALVEQIQKEATLYPPESELVEIRKIILRYLDDKEKQKASMLRRFGAEFREFYYALKTKNTAALVLNIDAEISELNYRLKPYRIKFTEFMSDAGSMDKDTGDITINSVAFDTIKKVDGKWDIKELMEVVGHELIHREQFVRGMSKSSYSQKAGGKKYWNDPAEVMAWAYSQIKNAIDKSGEETELKDVIQFIKTDPSLSEFLNRFEKKNRQKVVKHMIDYAKKEMEK